MINFIIGLAVGFVLGGLTIAYKRRPSKTIKDALLDKARYEVAKREMDRQKRYDGTFGNGYQPVWQANRPEPPPSDALLHFAEKCGEVHRDELYRRVMGDDIPAFLKRQAE